MSEQEFELYLKLLSRCLNLTPGQREQIADELRDHLEERLEELAQAGVPREKAVVQALDEFGDAAVLAGNFASIARLRRRRFLMRLSLGSVVALTAGLLIAYAFWPENRAVRGPQRVVAQDKDKAGLAQAAVQKLSNADASATKRPAKAGGLAGPTAPPMVEVCRLVSKDVIDYQAFQGNVQPSQLVRVLPLASGYLKGIHFRPGQLVKQGELLFEIDPSTCQAEVEKAAAQLAGSEARLQYAVAQFQRVQDSFRHNAISPEELDKAATERRVANADQQLAAANVVLAKARLSQTRIVAPISGHVSRSLIDVGNFLKAEESALATIVCLDPIYVSVQLDESAWFALRKRVKHGEFRDSEVPVEVFARQADDFQRKGTLEFVDDAAFMAGETAMRVRVPNGDGGLAPGLFVTVRYATGKPHAALLIPEKALGSNEGQRFVWVLGKRDIPERRTVAVARPYENDLREITGGLKPDEWIACDAGQMSRLPSGQTIEPKRVP
jgi:RND family efflux transporter MFP subunit